jgi:hypothetical protein
MFLNTKDIDTLGFYFVQLKWLNQEFVKIWPFVNEVPTFTGSFSIPHT